MPGGRKRIEWGGDAEEEEGVGIEGKKTLETQWEKYG